MMEILHSQVHLKHLEEVIMIPSVLHLEVSNVVLVKIHVFKTSICDMSMINFSCPFPLLFGWFSCTLQHLPLLQGL
jgi:hypothetical protein